MTALARELTDLTLAMPQQQPSAPVLRFVPPSRRARHALRLFAVLVLAAGLTLAVMAGFSSLVSGWGPI
ncbi:MAG: hypothetical protein CK552_01305 [Actinobacteria bacterium]|nr:MAG: hypothetical protein CK552_01305 [Actinomycetota bacterium]